MPENLRAFAALALAGFIAGTAMAQTKGGSSTIICWKDKAGKVIGCGDRVPPEYEDNATKELDRRGVTRKTTESAADGAKRAAEDAKLAKEKGELALQREDEKRRAIELNRQEAALIATFANEKEIDLKRDRDLDVADRLIAQLQAAQKNAQDRAEDLKSRIEASEKANKPVTNFLRDEAAHSASESARLEKVVAAKSRDREEIRKRYAYMKQRYIELQGADGPAPTAAKAPAAPAKK